MGATCKGDSRTMATMLTRTQLIAERDRLNKDLEQAHSAIKALEVGVFMASRCQKNGWHVQAELDQVAAYHRQGGTVGRRWANAWRRSCAEVVLIAERLWNFSMSMFMIFMPLSLNPEPPSWMPNAHWWIVFIFRFPLWKMRWWNPSR